VTGRIREVGCISEVVPPAVGHACRWPSEASRKIQSVPLRVVLGDELPTRRRRPVDSSPSSLEQIVWKCCLGVENWVDDSRRGRSLFRQTPGQCRRPRCRRGDRDDSIRMHRDAACHGRPRRRHSIRQTASQRFGPAYARRYSNARAGHLDGSLGAFSRIPARVADSFTGCGNRGDRVDGSIPIALIWCGGQPRLLAWSHATSSGHTAPLPRRRFESPTLRARSRAGREGHTGCDSPLPHR